MQASLQSQLRCTQKSAHFASHMPDQATFSGRAPYAGAANEGASETIQLCWRRAIAISVAVPGAAQSPYISRQALRIHLSDFSSDDCPVSRQIRCPARPHSPQNNHTSNLFSGHFANSARFFPDDSHCPVIPATRSCMSVLDYTCRRDSGTERT